MPNTYSYCNTYLSPTNYLVAFGTTLTGSVNQTLPLTCSGMGLATRDYTKPCILYSTFIVNLFTYFIQKHTPTSILICNFIKKVYKINSFIGMDYNNITKLNHCTLMHTILIFTNCGFTVNSHYLHHL